jgi:putative oxidoreductase
MKIIATLKHGYQWGAVNAEKFLEPLALFFMRFTVAKVFLDSGLLKWDGFLKFNIDTYDLFLYEFFCPEEARPGALLLCDPNTLDYAEGSLAVPFIELLALGAGIGEVILPVLLILGLFGRFAALGLLGMTLFIQLAVFPSWSHWVNPAVWWAATLLVLVARGPGFLSLDRLIKLEKK